MRQTNVVIAKTITELKTLRDRNIQTKKEIMSSVRHPDEVASIELDTNKGNGNEKQPK